MQTLLQIFNTEAPSESLTNGIKPENVEGILPTEVIVNDAPVFSLDLEKSIRTDNAGVINFLNTTPLENETNNFRKSTLGVDVDVFSIQPNAKLETPAVEPKLAESGVEGVTQSVKYDVSGTAPTVIKDTETVVPTTMAGPSISKSILPADDQNDPKSMLKSEAGRSQIEGAFAADKFVSGDNVQVPASDRTNPLEKSASEGSPTRRVDVQPENLTAKPITNRPIVQAEAMPARSLEPQIAVQRPSSVAASAQTIQTAQTEFTAKTTEAAQPKPKDLTEIAFKPVNVGALDEKQRTEHYPLPKETSIVRQEGTVPEKAAQQIPNNFKPKRPSAPLPVEIQYHPTDRQKATQENPKSAQTDVLQTELAQKEPATKIIPDASTKILIQKHEYARREPKSPLTGAPYSATDVETQLQSSATKQLESAQPKAFATPTPFPATSPNMEVLHVADTAQTRESGFQAPSEGAELRKESSAPSKIESFARPVVQQLTHALKTVSDGNIEVRLAPEELGRVRLLLTPSDAQMTVNISAERPETVDLIRRNIDLLSQSLKQEGFTNLSFSFGDQGREQHGAQDNEAPSEYLDEAGKIDAAPHSRPSSPNLLVGHIDIRI